MSGGARGPSGQTVEPVREGPMSTACSTRKGRGEGRLASPFFPVLTGSLTVAALFAFVGSGVAELLQYDRSALEHGQAWRWVLGHLTHWSADHLFWDLSTFLVLGIACERQSRGRFAATVALSAAAIPAARQTPGRRDRAPESATPVPLYRLQITSVLAAAAPRAGNPPARPNR